MIGQIKNQVEGDLARSLLWREIVFLYVTLPTASASVLLRTSDSLLDRGHRRLSRIVRSRLASKHGVHIAEGAVIGSGFRMPHPVAIVVGSGAVIGRSVTVYQGVTIGALIRASQRNSRPLATGSLFSAMP